MADICIKQPILIESILRLLDERITGVATPIEPSDATNKAYVDGLRDQILALLAQSDQTAADQFTAIQTLIASINGMDRLQVIAIVREIIGEEMSAEDITEIIQGQYGALLQALQAADTAMAARLDNHDLSIDRLNEDLASANTTIVTMQTIQVTLQATIASQAAQLQRLLEATQQISIKIRNGIFSAFDGILSGDVAIDCEGPTHANIILKLRGRKSPVLSVVRYLDGFALESIAAVAKINPEPDSGLQFGQILQVTLGKINGSIGDVDLDLTGGSPV